VKLQADMLRAQSQLITAIKSRDWPAVMRARAEASLLLQEVKDARVAGQRNRSSLGPPSPASALRERGR
jgi:hypothetical protein